MAKAAAHKHVCVECRKSWTCARKKFSPHSEDCAAAKKSVCNPCFEKLAEVSPGV